MGRSETLRLSDIRRVFRLVGDCRDLGHDRSAWMSRAAAGLREDLNALIAIGFFHGKLVDLKKSAVPDFWDVGWPTDRDRESWLSLVRAGAFLDYPSVRGIHRPTGRLVVRSREQMVPDREWRLSAELNEDRKPLGQDDILLARCKLSADPAVLQLFSINRAVKHRRFDGRDRAFLRLFVQEINRLAGTTLAIDPAGPFAGLTPRYRQVLEALLEGDGEKQIAARLGLSRHTVHDYVKALYLRFDVGSRGELLAAYHRFRRPS